ncbi:aldo/keto reductase [Cellulomonas sp. URHD0024]|uniref:aldo/keto reductase n=1 Tax=Cellulomonas sp. URHD0024 TaxID=1302620 RepID=UPI000418F8C6|nr:aldo/keto reductase [Cellulomonas sp. URHD0024]
MTVRQLGQSGPSVSVAGLGCNTFGATLAPDGVPALVVEALDAGITFFDTADVYGGTFGQSEELLGAALAGRRDDVVLASKFGAGAPEGVAPGSRAYVRTAVEASLQRLGTDRIDLYQMHVPDPVTPIEETLGALHELVVEGKVRYLGSSNFAAWQVVDADWSARTAGATPLVSAQNRYNLLARDAEAELIPALEQVGVALIPYVPLASGLLTGKYTRDDGAPEGSRLSRWPDRLASADFGRIEALEALAREWAITLPTLALGGLAAQPAVATVIAGARTPEQLRANVASILWEPTLDQLAAIDDAAPGPVG